MSAEGTVSVDELQVLLNYFGDKLKVKYPLYGFDLFHAQLDAEGYKLDLKCSDRDFDKELDEFGGIAREVPAYSDFRECLISSGVMTYTNMDAFRKRIKAYNSMRDEYKYSLDTNLLYHRFVSNTGSIKPSEIVLVDIVEDEIMSAQNHKYKQGAINELKNAARYQKEYIDELWNRRKKSSRRAAYIASRELQYMREGIANVLVSPDMDHRKDGEADRNIVRTLVKLKKEGGINPILLTADDALVDLCETANLSYFKFEMPHKIKKTHCGFKQMRELIFNLAAVFGFVKVNTAVIFGEFKGKTANNPDQLKLKILGSVPFDDFDRDLSACRRLMELKI